MLRTFLLAAAMFVCLFAAPAIADGCQSLSAFTIGSSATYKNVHVRKFDANQTKAILAMLAPDSNYDVDNLTVMDQDGQEDELLLLSKGDCIMYMGKFSRMMTEAVLRDAVGQEVNAD